MKTNFGVSAWRVIEMQNENHQRIDRISYILSIFAIHLNLLNIPSDCQKSVKNPINSTNIHLLSKIIHLNSIFWRMNRLNVIFLLLSYLGRVASTFYCCCNYILFRCFLFDRHRLCAIPSESLSNAKNLTHIWRAKKKRADSCTLASCFAKSSA